MAPAAVTGFRFLVSVVPAALIAVRLIFVFFYPLHGKKLEAVKTQCALAAASCPEPGAPFTGTPTI
jgi:Na+/melibiose symporter-like transporter